MHNTTHTPGPSTHARGRAGLISLIGVLALLAASLSTAFAATGGLYAQSLTLPTGGLWLPGPPGGPPWLSPHLPATSPPPPLPTPHPRPLLRRRQSRWADQPRPAGLRPRQEAGLCLGPLQQEPWCVAVDLQPRH